MNHKIEFREGEFFCRYDGILCNGDGRKLIYGYDDELPFFDERSIVMGDTLYTDNDLANVIMSVSNYQGELEDYDIIISKGCGLRNWAIRREYDYSYILPETYVDYFKGVKQIKPFVEFTKDYPYIDLEKYDEFTEALYKFYKQRKEE